ncbi:hypothetical protein TWF506_003205 [Arthrobotrys conoides]|uniref:Uncharacterized protein n=1 Tax=Arthrobotrys conoides TaxID=74498 RepID=A0AAN8N4M3_9PEZI
MHNSRLPGRSTFTIGVEPRSKSLQKDDFFVRLVLQKLLGSGSCLSTIRIHEKISIKSLHLILSAIPSLRNLKVEAIGRLDPIKLTFSSVPPENETKLNRPDRYEINALEKATEPLKIESLEFGIFENDLALSLLQTVRRCGSTMREFFIGIKSPGETNFETWSSSYDGGGLEAMMEEGDVISLPALEKLSIISDIQTNTSITGFSQLFIHLVRDCQRLTKLKFEYCDVRKIMLALQEQGAKIQSLQIYPGIPLESPNEETNLLETRGSLQTLSMTPHPRANSPDIDTIFEHRGSIKRLCLRCGNGCFTRDKPYSCTVMSTLLGSSEATKQHQLNMENWPQLEELGIECTSLETIPIIHRLKFLFLMLNNPTSERVVSEQKYKDIVDQYIVKLWRDSMSRYGEPPKLQVLATPRRHSPVIDYGVIYYVPHAELKLPDGTPVVTQYTALSDIFEEPSWSVLLEKNNDQDHTFWE